MLLITVTYFLHTLSPSLLHIGCWMWWLVLYVNFTRPQGTRHLPRPYFGCLWGSFWMSLMPESVDWVKHCPPQCQWASFNQLETWIEQRSWMRTITSWLSAGLGNYSFPAFTFGLKHWLFLSPKPAGFWTGSKPSAPMVLRPSDSIWSYMLLLLCLQLADCMSWDFPASIIAKTKSLLFTCRHIYIHTH